MERDYVPPLGKRDEEQDPLTGAVIAAAIEVHRELGPGLSEAIYEEALCLELELRGIRYRRQISIPVVYKGKAVGVTRLDLLVEDELVIDLKVTDGFNPVQRAQMICYLHVSKKRIGLIINFNVAVLKDGIKRVILSSC